MATEDPAVGNMELDSTRTSTPEKSTEQVLANPTCSVPSNKSNEMILAKSTLSTPSNMSTERASTEVTTKSSDIETRLSNLTLGHEHSTPMTKTTARLDTFTHFPRLPKELRLKIWRLLEPPPSLIQFKCEEDILTLAKRRFEMDPHMKYSTTPYIPTLCICRESRKEALTTCSVLLKHGQLSFRRYLRPKTDTLFFDESFSCECYQGCPFRGTSYAELLQIAHESTANRLKHIAIDIEWFLEQPEEDCLPPLLRFQVLEKVTFVLVGMLCVEYNEVEGRPRRVKQLEPEEANLVDFNNPDCDLQHMSRA